MTGCFYTVHELCNIVTILNWINYVDPIDIVSIIINKWFCCGVRSWIHSNSSSF